MTTGIIDYGAGNLRSVLQAAELLGFNAGLVEKPNQFDGLETLVLPGQGTFGDSVRQLRERDLWHPIKDWISSGRPYLGICLGYHLLFDSSEESPGVSGFGIYSGQVKRFRGTGLKIPHMGWNTLQLIDSSKPIWRGLPDHPHVYFVHSFYPEPEDESLVACRTDYGINFASAVEHENLVATQFHPEKSQTVGLRILRNFLDKAVS